MLPRLQEAPLAQLKHRLTALRMALRVPLLHQPVEVIQTLVMGPLMVLLPRTAALVLLLRPRMALMAALAQRQRQPQHLAPLPATVPVMAPAIPPMIPMTTTSRTATATSTFPSPTLPRPTP
jgi:hypothetical protein